MDDPTDVQLMEHAARFYRQPGARTAAIRDELGLTNTRFWQLVLGVLADPARISALPPALGVAAKRLKERVAA